MVTKIGRRIPLVENQLNHCSTYRIGLELVKAVPYRSVTGCQGQDHKSAGQSRRSIFYFLSQAHQEAHERSLVTTGQQGGFCPNDDAGIWGSGE